LDKHCQDQIHSVESGIPLVPVPIGTFRIIEHILEGKLIGRLVTADIQPGQQCKNNQTEQYRFNGTVLFYLFRQYSQKVQ
jgi:hypothetical protein